MKNDFKKGNIKISVPPTILYSMTAKIDDVRKTHTSDFKVDGDLIYQVGKTYNELGGSEFYFLHHELGANVPVVRKEDAKRIYHKMMKAGSESLIESAHDISDGGLAVALAECCFNTDMGCQIRIPERNLSAEAECFAESHSRFIVTVTPDNKEHFEAIFADDSTFLGKVRNNGRFNLRFGDRLLADAAVCDLREKWKNGLRY